MKKIKNCGEGLEELYPSSAQKNRILSVVECARICCHIDYDRTERIFEINAMFQR